MPHWEHATRQHTTPATHLPCTLPTWKVTTTSNIQPPFVFQEPTKHRSKVAGAPSASNCTTLRHSKREASERREQVCGMVD